MSTATAPPPDKTEAPPGVFGRLLGRGKKVTKAKLGEELDMYFNEELKAWVKRGEEEEVRAAKAALAAPPPLALRQQHGGLSDGGPGAALPPPMAAVGAPGRPLGVASRYAAAPAFGLGAPPPALPENAPSMFGGLKPSLGSQGADGPIATFRPPPAAAGAAQTALLQPATQAAARRAPSRGTSAAGSAAPTPRAADAAAPPVAPWALPGGAATSQDPLAGTGIESSSWAASGVEPANGAGEVHAPDHAPAGGGIREAPPAPAPPPPAPHEPESWASDPVFQEVLAFWWVYRAAGWPAESMAAWAAQHYDPPHAELDYEAMLLDPGMQALAAEYVAAHPNRTSPQGSPRRGEEGGGLWRAGMPGSPAAGLHGAADLDGGAADLPEDGAGPPTAFAAAAYSIEEEAHGAGVYTQQATLCSMDAGAYAGDAGAYADGAAGAYADGAAGAYADGAAGAYADGAYADGAAGAYADGAAGVYAVDAEAYSVDAEAYAGGSAGEQDASAGAGSGEQSAVARLPGSWSVPDRVGSIWQHAEAGDGWAAPTQVALGVDGYDPEGADVPGEDGATASVQYQPQAARELQYPGADEMAAWQDLPGAAPGLASERFAAHGAGPGVDGQLPVLEPQPFAGFDESEEPGAGDGHAGWGDAGQPSEEAAAVRPSEAAAAIWPGEESPAVQQGEEASAVRPGQPADPSLGDILGGFLRPHLQNFVGGRPGPEGPESTAPGTAPHALTAIVGGVGGTLKELLGGPSTDSGKMTAHLPWEGSEAALGNGPEAEATRWAEAGPHEWGSQAEAGGAEDTSHGAPQPSRGAEGLAGEDARLYTLPAATEFAHDIDPGRSAHRHLGPMSPGRLASELGVPRSALTSAAAVVAASDADTLSTREAASDDEAEGQDVGPPVAEDEAVHENGRAADWGAPADGPGLPSGAGVAVDALPSQDPSPRFAALAEDLDAGADAWGEAWDEGGLDLGELGEPSPPAKGAASAGEVQDASPHGDPVAGLEGSTPERSASAAEPESPGFTAFAPAPGRFPWDTPELAPAGRSAEPSASAELDAREAAQVVGGDVHDLAAGAGSAGGEAGPVGHALLSQAVQAPAWSSVHENAAAGSPPRGRPGSEEGALRDDRAAAVEAELAASRALVEELRGRAEAGAAEAAAARAEAAELRAQAEEGAAALETARAELRARDERLAEAERARSVSEAAAAEDLARARSRAEALRGELEAARAARDEALAARSPAGEDLAAALEAARERCDELRATLDAERRSRHGALSAAAREADRLRDRLEDAEEEAEAAREGAARRVQEALRDVRDRMRAAVERKEADLRAAVEAGAAALEAARDAAADAERERDAARAEAAAAAARVDDLSRKFALAKKKIAVGAGAARTAQDRIAELEAELAAAQAGGERVDPAELRARDAELESLRGQLQDAQAMLSQLGQGQTAMEEELARLRQQHAQELEDLDAENLKLMDLLESKTEAAAEAAAEAEAARAELAGVQAAAEARLAQAQAEMEAWRVAAEATSREEITGLREEAESLRAEEASLRAEAEALREEAQGLQSHLIATEAELRALETEREELRALETEREELRSRLEEAERALGEARRELEERGGAADPETVRELESARAQVHGLGAQLLEMQGALEAAEVGVAGPAGERVAALEAEVEAQRAERADLHAMLESLRAELAAAEEAAATAAADAAAAATAAAADDLKRHKLQLIKAKKARAADAERIAELTRRCEVAEAAALGAAAGGPEAALELEGVRHQLAEAREEALEAMSVAERAIADLDAAAGEKAGAEARVAGAEAKTREAEARAAEAEARAREAEARAAEAEAALARAAGQAAATTPAAAPADDVAAQIAEAEEQLADCLTSLGQEEAKVQALVQALVDRGADPAWVEATLAAVEEEAGWGGDEATQGEDAPSAPQEAWSPDEAAALRSGSGAAAPWHGESVPDEPQPQPYEAQGCDPQAYQAPQVHEPEPEGSPVDAQASEAVLPEQHAPVFHYGAGEEAEQPVYVAQDAETAWTASNSFCGWDGDEDVTADEGLPPPLPFHNDAQPESDWGAASSSTAVGEMAAGGMGCPPQEDAAFFEDIALDGNPGWQQGGWNDDDDVFA
ncbi:hypothetical protein ACKKBG_A11485 [Auxenochlorella protothecoides x Auxenochlorella symbiontica]